MKTETDVTTLSLTEASERLRARQLTSIGLTQACLERIRERDPELNSFITITADSALEQARAADAELRQGNQRGPLHGIPIAVKDLIDIAGVKTTAGSALRADNVAQTDAEVTRRLGDAGAVLLGKLNLHEFAYGGSGVISAYGPVKNPANPRHITGGSSSGSAAAVGGGLCFGAIGTDTAGSIRLPAACCGIVGFKPTYGTVSLQGVVELSHSYDHVGPMTRTVADAAAIFKAIAGTAAGKHPMLSMNEVRVGILRKFFFDDLDSEVGAAMDAVISLLSSLCTVRDVEFPVDADRSVQMYESWKYHETWVRTLPDKYDPQTLKRIQRGAEVSDEEYRLRLAELQETRAGVPALFRNSNVDVVVTPTSPIPPPTFAEVMADPNTLRARELVMLRNTRPFNVWGTPAISVPCGRTKADLPIGIQFAAPPGEDATLLRFAADFERLGRG